MLVLVPERRVADQQDIQDHALKFNIIIIISVIISIIVIIIINQQGFNIGAAAYEIHL